MLIKLKKRLSQNIHLYELLKGSSIALIMRLLGMLLVYVFSILLARSYGAETLGLFTLSLTVLNILTTIAVFGFDNTLVKFISEYNNKKKYHILSQIYKQSLIITMTISITLSIVLFLGSDYLALQIFNNPDLIIFFQIVSIGIVPSAFLIINASTFRGLKDIKNSSFFQNVGLYIFVIIILSLFINYYNGKEGLILAYIISIYFNAIVSYMALKKHLYFNKHTLILSYKKIIKVSFPMLMTSAMALIMLWTDTIMLGVFRSEEDVGIYSVVIKLAGVTSIILASINSVAAPKFSECFSSGDITGLKIVVQKSTSLIIIGSLPIILLLIFFSDYILAIYGKKFLVGQTALYILIFGQFINMMTGPVGTILNMAGKQVLFNKIIIFCSILNVILNYFLVQKYGLNGVAISTAISLAFLNLIPFFYIKYYFGFYTINFRRNK